jgi:hypothetical protein
MSTPVSESGVVHAMDQSALLSIQIASAIIVNRMTGPAKASYLRIISMP